MNEQLRFQTKQEKSNQLEFETEQEMNEQLKFRIWTREQSTQV